jgi:hypothetical protein
MWVELLVGATLLAIIYLQREHMATGVYDKTTPPNDEETSDIFDQIMGMSPSILHDAYTEALALAQAAHADARVYADKVPSDPFLQGSKTISDAKLIQISKTVVVTSVLTAGNEIKKQGGSITEENIKAFVESLYTKLNQHIDDVQPTVAPLPNATPVQIEVSAKLREYTERARTLVKKYDNDAVRDSCAAVLKMYYIDQLKPGWSTPAAARAAAEPTASGNMTDLETEYQQRKTVYDNLVAQALEKDDITKLDAIAAAKQAMNDTLSKMLALSAKTGSSDQQDDLIRRVMEIQRDYNGLLVATDKLETLRRIHQITDVRDGAALKIYGLAFLVAVIGLMILVMRTH